MNDPYVTLGVPRSADHETIRKAFRRLAREFHPDVNTAPGAEDRFKEVNQAYDILGDPDKRALWDEFGELSLRPGFDATEARAWSAQQQGGPGFEDFFGGFGAQGGMDDFLSSMFGAGSSYQAGPTPRRRARKGSDQYSDVTIDFMLAVIGGELTLRIPRHGRTETVKVRLPAGAEDGKTLRIPGHGHPPAGGGPAGDLVLSVKVRAHPVLRRAGDDLEMDVPITILEAMQGGAVTIPTPTGEVKVNVPAGAGSGRRLRLRGKGVQRRGRPGDLYLILRPVVPQSSDPELVEAARTLEKAYPLGGVRRNLRL